MKYAESHWRRLRRHSVYEMGRKYLDHMMENGNFEDLGPLYQRIFKNDKRLWEEEVTRLILLNHVEAIGPYVPLGNRDAKTGASQTKLEPHIYEAILVAMFKLDPRQDALLLEMIRSWPPQLYDVSKIVALLLDQLLQLPDNQTLLRALATLYSYQKKYDKSMSVYLKLGHKDVFHLIR